MIHHAKAASAGSTEATGKRRGTLLATLALAICALALSASPAVASPPVTTMGTASGASYASAQVTGKVDAKGIFSEWFFETSTDEVNWVRSNLAGFAAGGEEEFQGELLGLKGGTTYFVRLSAYNFDEFAEVHSPGPNPSFTTLPVDPPVVLSIDNASNLSYTSVKAEGKVERPANPDPAFNANCRFEYVTDDQFNATGFDGAPRSACDVDPVSTPEAKEPVEANLSGLEPATTYHLRLRASNAGGSDSKEAASTFTTLAVTPPSVAIDPVTTFGATSARFSGKVDPNGSDPVFDTSWRFECVPACGLPLESFYADGVERLVAKDVSGLEPNTDYEVKLVASNQGGANETAPVAFKTAFLAPGAQTLYASEVEANSATLAAKVNPHNSPITYRFEYGLDASYGSFAPASPVSLADVDNANHEVSQAIAGLQEDATYHFRIVATNTDTNETAKGVDHTFTTPPAAGPTPCANEQLRAENNSLNLPECRAFEMVSPVVKSGNDAGTPGDKPNYSLATADGNGVLFGTRGPMGTVHRGLQSYAVGRRSPEGWSSESALPSGFAERIFAISYAPTSLVPSSDLSKFIFAASARYVADNTGPALYKSYADGAIEWLTRPQIPNPVPAPGAIGSRSNLQPVGASPDLSTFYFWSGPTLLPEDAARTPFYDPGEPAGAGPWGMYEYSDGVLKAAGTLPDGSEDPGGAAPASSGTTGRRDFNLVSPDSTGNQVSRDGSTLWFVSPDPGPNPALGPMTQLYVRRDGHSTLVSHAPDGSPAPSGVTPVFTKNPWADPRPHQYAFGSPDGKKTIFQSVDVLAPGAPSDSSVKAYRYDVETDTVTYLPGVHAGDEPDTVVAASEDGSRFLFGNTRHIAVWDNGVVKPIASGNGLLSPARATASGSAFLFVSPLSIDGANTGGSTQVYRYDADSGQTTCLSCPPDAVVPSGDARLSNQDSDVKQPGGELVASRGMSEDAGRVFFDTPDPLLPEDINGKRDVYEWTPGGVALISSGKSTDNSYFLDNGADGDDVFFATAEGLDPRDTDGVYDVYDARVGGGFAQTQAVAPCLGNEVCKGASPRPPSQPGPATNSFSGNGEDPRPRSTNAIKVGSHQVVGGTLALKVTLPKGGTLAASGKGLKSARHTYAKAGSYQLKIPLKPSARKALREKHKLKLKVHLRFSPKSGKPSSANVVLTVKG